MKYLMLFLIANLFMTGCDTHRNSGSYPLPAKYIVVEIEGAKYIAYQTSYGYWNYSPIVSNCNKLDQ